MRLSDRSSLLGDCGTGAGGMFSGEHVGVWCLCEADATSAPVGGCLVPPRAGVGTSGKTPGRVGGVGAWMAVNTVSGGVSAISVCCGLAGGELSIRV